MSNLENRKIETCRLCSSALLSPIISLGSQYINDFPPSINQKGRNGECPLDVVLCEKCKLYQLSHTAPQELLYSKHYWYKSGISNTITNDLKDITEIAKDYVKLSPSDIYLDIGANDGTMLKNLAGKCIRVGCEPALNLIDELKTNCEHVIGDFWNIENYEILNLPKAKVITAIGMFYDMDDPNQFIFDAAKALSNDGLFLAQLMTLKPMLENNDLGNICHEHLEYYTYDSLKYLFESNGLEIFKIEENKINGGSYRIFARHFRNGSIEWKENLTNKDVLDFKNRIDKNKKDCIEYLNRQKENGKKIYVYGASTKGNCILQYYGLSNKQIIAAADKNEAKWGAYTLTDIPIISEDEAREKADIFLILPFGFVDEFVKREKKWLSNGGEFIVPLPEFRIINKESLL